MGDIRLREDTLKAKFTYKNILTGINKEGTESKATCPRYTVIAVYILFIFPSVTLTVSVCTSFYLHQLAVYQGFVDFQDNDRQQQYLLIICTAS
jgi:hypothetical protein